MIRKLVLIPIPLLAACALPGAGPEPSLAPRAAESIDPRVPVGEGPPASTVADPALSRELAAAVERASGGAAAFDQLAGQVDQLAARSGARGSEAWIAAQQALSRLVAQKTVTEQAAGDVDELAASRLQAQRSIAPADRAAILAAQADIARINEAQAATIDRIRSRLD
jgi:hypothetical protein